MTTDNGQQPVALLIALTRDAIRTLESATGNLAASGELNSQARSFLTEFELQTGALWGRIKQVEDAQRTGPETCFKCLTDGHCYHHCYCPSCRKRWDDR